MLIVIILGVLSLFGFVQIFDLDIIEAIFAIGSVILLPYFALNYLQSEDGKKFEDKILSKEQNGAIFFVIYLIFAFAIYKLTYSYFYVRLDTQGSRSLAPILIFAMALLLTLPVLTCLWLMADKAGLFKRFVTPPPAGSGGGARKAPSLEDETDFSFDVSRFPERGEQPSATVSAASSESKVIQLHRPDQPTRLH